MMHFRKKSRMSNSEEDPHTQEVKLSREDQERLKVRTASVADPILDAVQEAQPFEQAADTSEDYLNRQSYFMGENDQILRDIFGQPIQQPDISNPTRARDERPLDTIRSFEYAISGDPTWAQQLETQQFGFRVRPDFPMFGNSNPYDNQQQQQGNPQMYGEQAVYQAPVASDDGDKKKKKKRNFFGRKKKE